MFERYSDRARRAVTLAQDAAHELQHSYIGTEHLLLGLAREDGGVAHQVLADLGLTYDATREAVTRRVAPGPRPSTGHLPFTPRSKRSFELALRESLQLGHNYVGTEHLLLGVIREGEGVGAQVIGDLPAARAAVMKRLEKYPTASAIERVLTNDRLRGYTDIQLALEESYEKGRADALAELPPPPPHDCGLPHEVAIHIQSLPYQSADATVDGCDWPATIVKPHHSDSTVPTYVIQGDPNAVAVGRFKSSLRKFLGVD